MILPSHRLSMRLPLLLLLTLTLILTILSTVHGKRSDSVTLEDDDSPTLSANPSEVDNSRSRRSYGYGDSHFYRFQHPLLAQWHNSRHHGYPDYGHHFYHHQQQQQHYHDAWPFRGTPNFYPYIHRDGLCSFEKPFLCWGTKTCVRLSHVCDGNYDCPNHMDEHPDICVAGKRPSLENMEEFLDAQKAWIVPHLFNNAAVGAIAQALKNVENVEQLRWRLSLKEENVVNIKAGFEAAKSNNSTTLEALGMEKASWQTVKYFFTTLSETGFSTS